MGILRKRVDPQGKKSERFKKSVHGSFVIEFRVNHMLIQHFLRPRVFGRLQKTVGLCNARGGRVFL